MSTSAVSCSGETKRIPFGFTGILQDVVKGDDGEKVAALAIPLGFARQRLMEDFRDMANDFDATMKDLVRDYTADFLMEFDQPPQGPCSLLNVDLSTVTLASDIIVGINDPPTEVIHLEFQASASASKHIDVLAYNALLYRRYAVPVHTIVILLRPKAGHSNLNGEVNYSARPGLGRMNFEYEMVELWQTPAEDLLSRNIGILPLALLGRLPEDVSQQTAVQTVFDRMSKRIIEETGHDQSVHLFTSAYLLSGLRLPRDEARRLFQGVAKHMKESETYMMILDEGKEIGREEGKEIGREEGMEIGREEGKEIGREEGKEIGREEATRNMLRIFGEERFGPLDNSDEAKLEAIKNLDKLQELARKLAKVSGWKELFGTVNGAEPAS